MLHIYKYKAAHRQVTLAASSVLVKNKSMPPKVVLRGPSQTSLSHS